MSKKISRRSFFNRSVMLGAGTVLFKNANFLYAQGSGNIPIIVTSHTNDTGKAAMDVGWDILQSGGNALDAVEKAANVIENDPDDHSVGYGGLPNEDGVVQLDSSIMDGKTYNAGAVACIENIKNPCSVARVVMERTDHVLLVGKGALRFAKKWGFKEENLLTDEAREIWIKWKESLNDRDDWGPPDHLIDSKKFGHIFDIEKEIEHHYGTTNVLAVDGNGDIAGITTTSGLSFKIPGRVGDSPIIGAGLYVDNEVGAAGATGRGEDVIKCCASFYIVMRMKEGRSPQQACEDAVQMIIDKYKHVNPDFFPSEKFIAINKNGEWGCARMKGSKRPGMSVKTTVGYKIGKGSLFTR